LRAYCSNNCPGVAVYRVHYLCQSMQTVHFTAYQVRGGYSAYSPLGILTEGKSYQHLREMAAEAAALHLDTKEALDVVISVRRSMQLRVVGKRA
jgi:predicted RNase H-like HicB family nuclease